MSKGFKIWMCFVLVLMLGLILLTKTNILTNSGFATTKYNDEDMQAIIDKVDEGQRFIVLNRMGHSDFNHLIDVLYDAPELFWLDLEYHALSIGDLSILFLKEKYDDIDAKRAEIDRTVDAKLEQIITDDMSEYDKVLAIHDWICKSVEYKTVKNDSDQDIYGAFILNQAVCAGYAKAFSYALDKVGIESEVISGDSINRNGDSVAHAWNIVYIDDKPYYFDITWDDDYNDEVSYVWFGVTSSEFKTTHFPNTGYNWVEAEETQHCYYRKNGMYMDSYSAEFLAKQIRAQGKEFTIKCASRKVLNDTIRSFTTKSELQKLMRATGITFIDRIIYEEVKGSNCLHVKIM